MTYLEYTNIVLQAVNEGPMTAQQFAAARGLQQFAKDSVNRAYFDIVEEHQWPWLQSKDATAVDSLELSGERSIIPLTQWTQIPVDNPYKDAVDWSSIYYRDSEGTKHPLTLVSWDQYEDSQDFIDRETKTCYIIQSADGRSMGLSKLPTENVGKIYYRIWSRPSKFQFATDEVPMPDMHYTALVDGALHHMWSFRGDTNQAAMAEQRFLRRLTKMKRKYGNQSIRMRWV